MLAELTTQFDSRKSFGGKATLANTGGVLSLYSYNTLVATVDTNTDTVELHPRWNESATTLRHVKEFLKQNGYKAETKAQIAQDYS